MTQSKNVYRLFGHNDPFDKDYGFVSSWALPSVLHGCLRLFLSLYAFTAIVYSFSWFSQNIDIYRLKDIGVPEFTIVIGSAAIGRSFSYFTYLSYWGQAFYFFVTAVHTFTYARTKTSLLHTRLPRFLQLLHSLFYSCVTCFPILVSVVFWGTMYTRPWYDTIFDAWANISIHALNSFMAALEVLLTTTEPLPWMHLTVLMLILSLYLGLAYLTRATGGFWVYAWLDPGFGWWKVVAHIAGYSVGTVVIFVMVRYAIWTRNWLLARFRRRNIPRESDDALEKYKSSDAASSQSNQALLLDVEAQDRPVSLAAPAPTSGLQPQVVP